MINFFYFFLIFFSLFLLFAGTYNLIFLDKVTKQQIDKAKLKAVKKNREFHENIKKAKIRMLLSIFVNIGIGLVLLISYITQIDIAIEKDNNLTLLVGNPINDQNYLIVEETIQDYIDDALPLTMVIGFIDGDKEYLFGYGNIGVTGEQVTKDSVYEIGSISKAVTGLMLASSIEDGLISLSDIVGDCLIEQGLNNDSVVKTIMIQNLVTHTSGLNRLPASPRFTLNVYLSGVFGSNPYQSVTESEMIKSMNDLNKLNDDSWEYSNYGAGIMGMCLASVHQKSYEELLQEIITEPLGMTNTSTTYHEEVLYVDGYRGVLRLGKLTVGVKTDSWLLGEGIVSAGGIRSTGSDMLKLLDALVNNDFSFSNQATTPLVRINDSREIAMFWLIDELENSEEITWHNGMTGGYSSFIGVNENSQGIFILTNQTNDVTELGFNILENLLE